MWSIYITPLSYSTNVFDWFALLIGKLLDSTAWAVSQFGTAYAAVLTEGFFPLLFYEHALIQQLLHQSLAWQGTKVQKEEKNLDENDSELFSADEEDYTMKINQEKRGLGKNTVKDIEEKHLESISEPTTFYGLLLPPTNFEPLKSDNHSRDWKFPLEFGTGPQVCSPQ